MGHHETQEYKDKEDNMDSDIIRKAISVIDKQLAQMADLAKARETLVRMVGSLESSTSKEDDEKPISRAAVLIQRAEAAKGESRKETIIKLLDKEGPLTRTEMAHKSGIPLGTLSFVLKDRNIFNNQDGKWSLIVNAPESKEIVENKEEIPS